MKKLLLFFLVMTAVVSYGWAQQVVSGTVKSAEDGVTLPGVAIVIVGTTQGTVTDGDGNYRLEVPAGARLKFSYVGYQSQEINVGNQSVINLSLAADITELSEIVVTALSIEKDTKALGYSVTSVSGDNLTQARENNLANALEGRVAGVNVSKVNSGPGGSTRVIIRGNRFLEGNNQPLYVVDGIPMDNSGFGQAGIWGGRDEGDGLASINPDDIASITVLKGANAAALYGARAANGVINIVTKKGSERKKGIGIEFNSNMVFERINDQSETQTKYGGGGWINDIASKPTTLQEAWNWSANGWGPAYDGSQVLHFDGKMYPYEYQDDQLKKYYETGTSWTNSIALTGGSENQNFRASFSNLSQTGVIPNSGFDRKNFSLSTNSKFGDRVTLVGKVMYSNEYVKNRPYLSDSPANGIQAVWLLARDYDVETLKGDPGKLGAIPVGTDPSLLGVWGKQPGEEYQHLNNNWMQNPYWTAYQFIEDDTRDRLISSGQLRFDITDFLYIQGRAGMDWFTRRDTNLVPQGTGYSRGGSLSEGEDRVKETNYEWILGFNKNFSLLSVNAIVGGNAMHRVTNRLSANGTGFNVPFFQAINNAKSRNYSYGFSEMGINSLFGSAEFGYNEIVYISATGRQDWFSVLNPDVKNEIFYPSVGGSFILSEAFTLPQAISFAKLRLSWARVGNVTVSPYSVNLTYSLKDSHLSRSMASFSSAGGGMGRIPNPGIKPPTSTEIETGFDIRFFDDKLGIDFTYYSQKTTDDILNATIAPASGFATTTVNVGELKNSGIEVLITATPVRGPLTWDVALNFAKNSNEVVSLIEGQTALSLEEPRTRNVFVKHIVGSPFGMLTARRHLTVNGQKVYDAQGRAVPTSLYEPIGNGIADWTGGFENTFTFKNFNLSALVDFKLGGDIVSGTNMRLTSAGFHKQSLIGRAGEEPLHIKGVTNTGTTDAPIWTAVDRDLTPVEARSYWSSSQGETTGIPEMYMYDASFVKLRQLTFGYNFPQSLLSKTPFQNLALSFVGRNLLVLYKNIENVDPEAAYSNSNSQGLDYFGMLATRTYGFNLRASF